jgi:membrane-associated protein
VKDLLDLFLHLPAHLLVFTQTHGNLVYGLLFLIIFCETGLVVTPFLPGDSLLFAVGAVAAKEGSGLNIWTAAAVLSGAALLGDSTNYWIGRILGQWMVKRFPRIVKPEYLTKTNAFFARYGGKTIILARFVPIVRTFTPFVAGTGRMNYGTFLGFSVLSAALWVGLVLPAGWILGRIPFFQDHFEVVVLVIVAISILPMVVEYLKARSKAKEPVES